MNDYSKGDTIGLNTKVLLLKNVWDQNSWIIQKNIFILTLKFIYIIYV